MSDGNCVLLPADSMRLGLKTHIRPVPLCYDDNDDFDFFFKKREGVQSSDTRWRCPPT